MSQKYNLLVKSIFLSTLFFIGCFVTDLTNDSSPWYYRSHPQCVVYLDESIKTEMLRYGPNYKPVAYDPHYLSWINCIQREFNSGRIIDGGLSD